MKDKIPKFFAMLFVAVGALNWGIYGFTRLVFNRGGFNLVDWIFNPGTVANMIYIVVGISAIYLIYESFRK